jgi:hypothetical protein
MGPQVVPWGDKEDCATAKRAVLAACAATLGGPIKISVPPRIMDPIGSAPFIPLKLIAVAKVWACKEIAVVAQKRKTTQTRFHIFSLVIGFSVALSLTHCTAAANCKGKWSSPTEQERLLSGARSGVKGPRRRLPHHQTKLMAQSVGSGRLNIHPIAR